MKYYVVCSKFYDDGRVAANLVDVVDSDKRPKTLFSCKSNHDVYTDYFDSREEAEKYIEETEKENEYDKQ